MAGAADPTPSRHRALLLLLALLGLVPCTLGFVVPSTSRQQQPLTRRHFKVPTEPVPVVDTLEKKGNLTWTLPGTCMYVDV